MRSSFARHWQSVIAAFPVADARSRPRRARAAARGSLIILSPQASRRVDHADSIYEATEQPRYNELIRAYRRPRIR